ncbi:PREDICTED: uncharacterized protein LOC109338279 [Lupinus angustifolius]|uniref:uncharacterized protein LOC109338279 n=1 Tax=Lupinus angustifolius TaxID=3871 RepID=UPI00092EA89B|nr:PREDICTED: uncharacterized protein LOC109338279 [Lupinus angustifolius]
MEESIHVTFDETNPYMEEMSIVDDDDIPTTSLENSITETTTNIEKLNIDDVLPSQDDHIHSDLPKEWRTHRYHPIDNFIGDIRPREEVDLLASNLGSIDLEDGNRLRPIIYIDDSVFEELCNPWKDVLVVKLIDKKLGFFAMKERLKATWKLVGTFDILYVDNGFYMVKFERVIYREKVMEGGPWLIFYHCLAVITWSPEFASPLAKVNKTLVWIRFPSLKIMYYDPSVLKLMASVVGKPVRVDTNTHNVERGCFARVGVEIDLTQPIIGKVWMPGNWYKVQYEGLHMICVECGCYGHYTRDCNKKNEKNLQKANESEKGDHSDQINAGNMLNKGQATMANSRNNFGDAGEVGKKTTVAN